MKKWLTILLTVFLLTIPLIWSIVTSGYLFVKYENKCELIFNNQEVRIEANNNNFLINYDGKK